MIAFVTLFLGLVLGPQPVAVMVGPEVARVELRLDGLVEAELEGAPWIAECDLGDELVPRRLEAVAFDAAGRETGRAAQWLNLPRAPAELALLIQPAAAGEPAAVLLSWESVEGGEPQAVEVTFDGRPLAVADPRRVPLPPHDPEQLHLLRAEVTFSSNLSSVVEVTFGGTYAERLNFDLTGVPVALGERRELPPADQLAGWLTLERRPLEVLAVDEGPAEVVIVRDEGARERFAAMDRPPGGLVRGRFGTVASGIDTRFVAGLGRDQRMRLLSPFAREVDHAAYPLHLFEPSATYQSEDTGLLRLLSRARPAAAGAQRLADAVAVAGMTAAAGSRRRAVVLVLGDDPADASQLTPLAVRAYLRALRVPLVVWRASPRPADPAWGEAVDVSTLTRLEAAARDLRRLLARQRILWVDGRHLPQQILLSERAEGISLAM